MLIVGGWACHKFLSMVKVSLINWHRTNAQFISFYLIYSQGICAAPRLTFGFYHLLYVSDKIYWKLSHIKSFWKVQNKTKKIFWSLPAPNCIMRGHLLDKSLNHYQQTIPFHFFFPKLMIGFYLQTVAVYIF